MELALRAALAAVVAVPAWVLWTWWRPLRRCHGRCGGDGRMAGRGVRAAAAAGLAGFAGGMVLTGNAGGGLAVGLLGAIAATRRPSGQGHQNCPDCGGSGREPKPMAAFLYERGLFSQPPERTGPGWRRARARRDRARASGRRLVR